MKEILVTLFPLFVLLIVTTAQSEVGQYLQTGSDYNHPYFIVWVNHSWTGLLLPLQVLWYRYSSRKRSRSEPEGVFKTQNSDSSQSVRKLSSATALLLEPAQSDYSSTNHDLNACSTNKDDLKNNLLDYSQEDSQQLKSAQEDVGTNGDWLQHLQERYGITKIHLLRSGLWMSAIYFIADYTWYLGLPKTSVGQSLAIFNSSCVFVYIFSLLLLKSERLHLMKCLAICSAFGGIALIAIFPSDNNAADEDDESTGSILIGDAFVLCTAITYALYSVLSDRYAFSDIDDPYVINTFNSVAGLVNIFIGWIGILIVHWADIERFSLPPSDSLWAFFGTALSSFLFNVIYLICIAQTTPLLTSVTMMLSCPLGALFDWIVYDDTFTWQGIIGVVLVFLSFILLTNAEYGNTESTPEEEAKDLPDKPIEEEQL